MSPFKDVQATSTSMHVLNCTHCRSFIFLLSFLSTCLSFLVVLLSFCNFSCNLSIFSIFVLLRFCCSTVLNFATCYSVVLGFATHCSLILGFCSNCEGFELFTGSRCCCFNRCSTKVMHLLRFNLFFLAMLHRLKFVLLAIFIQVFFTSLGMFDHVL
jgi:hypothetical protein